jgi:hypothetical protein
MTLGQPLPHIRRQQEPLLTIDCNEVLGHTPNRLKLNAPDATPVYATASTSTTRLGSPTQRWCFVSRKRESFVTDKLTVVPSRDRVRETWPRPANPIVVVGHRRLRARGSGIESDSPSPSSSGLSEARSPTSATSSPATSVTRSWHLHCAGGRRSIPWASPRPNPQRASRPRTWVDATERASAAGGRLLGRPTPDARGCPVAHGRGRRRPPPKRPPGATKHACRRPAASLLLVRVPCRRLSA